MPDTLELLEPNQISETVRRWESLDPPFSHALKSGISAAPALARLGIRLCLQERYADSLLVLRAAVGLSPNDPTLINNLAVVLERAGHSDQAIQCVQHSLALDRAQPDSWLFLGNLQRSRGDLTGAKSAYETALALQKNSPLAWQGLGFVHQEQRQYPAAIECFITCIKQSHVTAPLLSILGQLFYKTGQFTKSRDAYAAALEYDPQNPLYRQIHRETQFACAVIHDASIDESIAAYLADASASPGKDDPDLPKLLQTTFSLLTAHGFNDAAKRLGAKRAALYPASAAAAYLLHAVTGDSSIPRAPDAYVIECFDGFADRFDEHLVNTLGYDIPQQLAAALIRQIPANASLDVLDAGCGTGLCGPPIRAGAASLTGVDLSPRMLDRARNRHTAGRPIYDRLVCSELTAFLANTPRAFDAALAADVLIYFGDLAPLAAAFAHALRPGAFLAVSTERTTAPAHQLLTSGRFAHNPDYIHATFSQDFLTRSIQDITIRLEASHPVPGNIFILQRR